MDLDWTALGEVAGVSTGVTVAVVAVFALGVLGLSRADAARDASGTDASGTPGGTAPTAALAQAGLCFLVCAAVVAYGIYLIVPQFH